MKKVHAGVLFGAIAGAIDVIPMALQGISLDADLSAFSLWVVSGFLVSTSGMKTSGALKGLLVSFLVLLPAAILIGWQQPMSLAPIIIMTIMLGSVLGYLTEKFGS